QHRGVLPDGPHDLGVAVAEGVDGDAPDEVEVLLAVRVPETHPFPADEAKGGPGVVLHQVAVGPFEENLGVLAHRVLRMSAAGRDEVAKPDRRLRRRSGPERESPARDGARRVAPGRGRASSGSGQVAWPAYLTPDPGQGKGGWSPRSRR